MNAKPLKIATDAIIPLMATLPYAIVDDEPEFADISYYPCSQLTVYAGRNFSTCRYEESVGGILSKSRSDTQKDD